VALGVKISASTHLTEAARKAPGGLVRVGLLESDGKVADLMLSGDFTCLPPEGVDQLAAALYGTALTEAALTAAASAAMANLALDMPGVTPADLAASIMAAVVPAA